MKIGIIGAGSIGTAIAKHVAHAGYDTVISNSRGADTLKEKAELIGGNVKPGSVEEASQADVVFLAVRWQQVPDALKNISLVDKIVVDTTNWDTPESIEGKPGSKTSSEEVAEIAKGAKVVKAFNTLYAPVLAKDPNVNGGKRVIFYSGNDDQAKAEVSSIINRIGFAGVDLGTLHEGGKSQRYPGGSLPELNLIKY